MTKYVVFCGFCGRPSDYLYDKLPRLIYCKECKGRVWNIDYIELPTVLKKDQERERRFQRVKPIMDEIEKKLSVGRN